MRCVGVIIGAIFNAIGEYRAARVTVGSTGYYFFPHNLIQVQYGMIIDRGTGLPFVVYPAWKAIKCKPDRGFQRKMYPYCGP